MGPDGDHDGWVDRRYLFNCLQLVELVLGTRDSFEAALSQKAGTGAQATRGGPNGPRAVPSRETGARATGTRGGPRAAQAGRREPKPRGHEADPELP
jgi:hypothetical protein